MAFSYLTLFTALVISLGAAVYSIIGLTAIFAAAFWPIVIMGSSLEVGKIVTTLWLHKYWDRVELQYKLYLSSAVLILMVLTSMGVFGFLSKAHLDQAVPAGDIQAQVQIFDDKIKTQRDNIDAARRALVQMDSSVDQTMSRSTTEQGADKAANLRRSQARERGVLQADISRAQKEITALQEQRAPIASQARVLEAEVGPIKYIAALIYGDNPEANVLEKAVRWVIILIVVVFDPLAIVLLLAATKSLRWERDLLAPTRRNEPEPAYEPDDGPLTDDQIDQLQSLANKDLPTGPVITKTELFPMEDSPADPRASDLKKKTVLSGLDSMWSRTKNLIKKDSEAEHADLSTPAIAATTDTNANAPGLDAADERPGDYINSGETKASIPEHLNTLEKIWKEENPGNTLKRQRHLLETGAIKELPWNTAEFRAKINTGFGMDFPTDPAKGDMFIRTDRMPSELYKWNGTGWMHVDKQVSDSYAYNEAYIDHLIEKLATGEYDADLLSDAERNSIEHRLNHNT